MSAPTDDEFGFAPDYDSPVPYMQRTRDYYTAIGYTTPYRWAHYVDAPFHPMKKPLAQSRVTIVTTAAPTCGACPVLSASTNLSDSQTPGSSSPGYGDA